MEVCDIWFSFSTLAKFSNYTFWRFIIISNDNINIFLSCLNYTCWWIIHNFPRLKNWRDPRSFAPAIPTLPPLPTQNNGKRVSVPRVTMLMLTIDFYRISCWNIIAFELPSLNLKFICALVNKQNIIVAFILK